MIALSSPALSLMPLKDAVERVADEFRAWEIVSEGLHFLPEVEDELARILPSYDLEVSVHTPLSDINIGSLNPRMREASVNEVLRCIESAGRLGLGPFTLHPGFYTPLAMVDRRRAVDLTKRSLRLIEKAGIEHGVILALENMPAMPISMITTPAMLADMLEGTDLKVCWDIGHANTTGNIMEYLEMRDRFVNIHIHDNEGVFDQHLPIGKGNIEFAPILSGLKGYHGRFVIEARDLNEAGGSQVRLNDIMARL